MNKNCLEFSQINRLLCLGTDSLSDDDIWLLFEGDDLLLRDISLRSIHLRGGDGFLKKLFNKYENSSNNTEIILFLSALSQYQCLAPDENKTKTIISYIYINYLMKILMI